MNSVVSWLRSHSTAILATAIAVSKAGLLGKAGSVFAMALAAACGLTIS